MTMETAARPHSPSSGQQVELHLSPKILEQVALQQEQSTDTRSLLQTFTEMA